MTIKKYPMLNSLNLLFKKEFVFFNVVLSEICLKHK